MDHQALPQVERLIIEGKKRIARQRDVVAAAFQEGRDTLYPCCELLRRAFEPSKGTANSSLIGRKSQSEDDHGHPLFVLRDG